jgi:hypothetical protein
VRQKKPLTVPLTGLVDLDELGRRMDEQIARARAMAQLAAQMRDQAIEMKAAALQSRREKTGIRC